MNRFSFLAFCFLVLFLYGCKAPDKGYDLYIYSGESTAQFDAVCKVYSAQTGIRIKIGFPGQGKDYKNELKAALNAKSRPVIFSVFNIEEMEALREEGFIQDLSHAGDNVFADMVSAIPKPLRLGMEGNFGIPSALGAYGYLADRRMISALFGEGNEDAAIAAIKTASYEEWAALIQVIDRWIGYAFPYRVFLSGRLFLLTSVKADYALQLNGVFALGGGAVEEGNGAAKQVYGNHLANAALNAFVPLHMISELVVVDFQAGIKKPLLSDNEKLQSHVRPAFVDFVRALDMETAFPAGMDGPVRRQSFPFGGFEQSLKLFSQGKAIFLGADTRIYERLAALNPSMASSLELLPVKIPFRGLSYGKLNRSIAVYAAGFYAVNALVSPEEKKKAYDFLVWLNTTGREYNNDKTDFVFNAIDDYMKTGDVLASPLPAAFGVSLGKKLEEDFIRKPFWTEADYEAIVNYAMDEWYYK